MSKEKLKNIKLIRFASYKSFEKRTEPYDIDIDSNIILIIGRNNSGKSSLVDVVETASKLQQLSREKLDLENKYNGIDDICLGFLLDKKHMAGVFKSNMEVSPFGRLDLYSDRYINHVIVTKMSSDTAVPLMIMDSDCSVDIYKCELINHWKSVARKYYEELDGIKFCRINAERDIVPEKENNKSVRLQPNGAGLTNLVRMYINRDGLKESIVEKTILEELNKIVEPDAHYTGIRVQQIDNGYSRKDDTYKWEIFLEENGNRYALSKSGSGLKTIILVLVNLYLVPVMQDYKDSEIIYAFEELENNLHPALQRRLFEYICNYSKDNNVKIIMTSHSATAINTIYEKNDTHIYHVTKMGSTSTFEPVAQGTNVKSAIFDLGVKASDLFQANGIIWVEGPSDRIYIKKWLEVIGDCNYVEGRDYQFMYYGGRLLAHYTAKEIDEESDKELINILLINCNAVLVMDSDKKEENDDINDTKKRVKKELEEKGFFCWITEGREIENYISAVAVNATYGSSLDQIGQYESFPDYITEFDKTYALYKVKSARTISDHITKDNFECNMDLRKNITNIIRYIKEWKGIND